MSKSVFDEAIAIFGDPNCCENTISPAYQNMVGPFGGITAATLLNAVLSHPEVEGSPVSMTVNYLGAIKSAAMTVVPRLIRSNRSNQHWLVEAQADSEAVLTATIVVAQRRDTWKHQEINHPGAPAVNELTSLPIENMTPWVQQYDMRFVKGSLFEEVDENSEVLPSESMHWISDRPQRALDFLSLTAMSDSFFPRLFLIKRDFVPAGTVSYTVYFHVDQNQLAELQSPWALAHARASNFNGSYFDQTGELWSEDGQLLTTTTQMVYYKC